MKIKDRKIIEALVIQQSLDIPVGSSALSACPFCRASHEAKFSVTRTLEGLLYNCYRATCGARGFISSIPGTTQLELRKEKTFEPKEFKHNLEILPEWVVETINRKYEISKEDIHEQGFKWVPHQDRLFMPHFDRRGAEWGATTKVFGPGANGPKTVLYRTSQTTGLHYVYGKEGRGGPIAVTEDVLSALKVSRYIRAVALLGTSLHEYQIAELREETDHLILMLDPDMYQKMLRYKRKYSFYFRNFSVILLSKDPKDVQYSELERLIKGR